MARIIIIRNFYSYYITKSPTLDNMDGSDAILCWQSTNHHSDAELIATVLAWSHGSELPVSQIVTLIVLA